MIPNDPAAALAEAVRDMRASKCSTQSRAVVYAALAAYEEAAKQITYVGMNPLSERDGDKFQIENLVVLVMRLCALLPPDKQARVAALDYLQRHKLTPSPLREQIDAAKAVPAKPDITLNVEPGASPETIEALNEVARLAVRSDWIESLVEALYRDDRVSITWDGCRTPERDKFVLREIVTKHAPKEPAKPEASRVGDLCTLNARLIRALQKHEPDHPLIAKVIDYNTRHSLNGSPFRDEPEPAKPGDWMREAAADIIELTLDHPPKTSEELVKLLDTGAKVIAELCPAQPKREVSADSERLDWLDKTGGKLSCKAKWPEYFEGRRFWEWEGFEDAVRAQAVRNVIDSAMKNRARADTGGAT